MQTVARRPDRDALLFVVGLFATLFVVTLMLGVPGPV